MKSLQNLKKIYDKSVNILFAGILLLVFLAVPGAVTIKQAQNAIDIAMGVAFLVLDITAIVIYFILSVKIIKAIQDVLDDFKDKLE